MGTRAADSDQELGHHFPITSPHRQSLESIALPASHHREAAPRTARAGELVSASTVTGRTGRPD
jgi:hypothetical protein